MTKDEERQRLERAFAIVARLEPLEPGARATALAEECGDDLALRDRVLDLLAEVESNSSLLLDGPGPGASLRGLMIDEQGRADALPDRVGPFRVLKQIGQGGMGVVYEAEQGMPKRRVAVKVLRTDLASPASRERFRHEAEVLARLRHPGIAPLHEAGIDDTVPGHPLPWFSMELVSGRAITEHARLQELDVQERLRVLNQACEAVAHAHRQGVVHRDLKPDNILVDDDGRVRVLDFGIARVVDAAPEDRLDLTRTGDVLGTLAYMAPEQALGRSSLVDRRSDVHALGVIAFELLTGRLPLDLSELDLPTALQELARSEPARLSRYRPELAGDLDAIVETALARDPARRYDSVDGLLADLQRYLRGEPVLAHRPSIAYRAARLAHRHRGLVAALSAIVIVLAAGVIVASSFAVRERESANRARVAQYRAELEAAAAALREGDRKSAGRHLESAPEELRGFEWRFLSAQLDVSLLRVDLNGRASPADINNAVLSAGKGPDLVVGPATDGEPGWLRVLGVDAVVELSLRDAAARPLLRPGPGERLMALSPDGHRVLVLTTEKEVELVSLIDRTRLSLGPAPVSERGGHFTPDGSRAVVHATRPPSAGARWHDVSDGSVALELTAETFCQVTHGPGGRILFLHDGKAARVLDSRGALIVELEDSESWRTGQFTPDGDRVLGADRHGHTGLRDARTGEVLPWRDESSGRSAMGHVVFSSDGSRAAIHDLDRSQRLIDGRSGELLRRLERAATDARWPMAFVDQGRILASLGDDDTIRLVDAHDGSDRSVLIGPEQSVLALHAIPKSPLLVSLELGSLRVWDASLETRRVLRGHESYVYGVSLSPDGRRVASSSWDGTVRIWDLATGALVRSLDHARDDEAGASAYALVAHRPTGDLIAAVQGFDVRVWDLSDGRLLTKLPLAPPSDPVVAAPNYGHRPMAIAWHPTGSFVAVGSAGRPLQAWRVVGELPDPRFESIEWPSGAQALAFSPDGRRLLASVLDRIEVWSVSERRRELVLEGHEAGINALAISHDGRRLASAGTDGTVLTWDLETGRMEHALAAHSPRAFAVAFSPDGSRLATGGNEGALRLWDARTGEPLLRLRGHSDYVHALAWHPSGDVLISGSGDGELRLWETTTIREQARRRLR